MTATELGREPSRLPPANLAGAFGPADRGAALAGLLAPVVGATEPTTQAATQTDRRSSASGTDRLDSPRDAPRDDDSRPLTVIVYLPVSVRDRLREMAAVRGATYTELTLEAIDATHQRLGDLLTRTSVARRPDSLFSGSTPRRRERHSEPQVQVSLRLIRSQLDVVDRLVDDHSASSRSALVTAALRGHLS